MKKKIIAVALGAFLLFLASNAQAYALFFAGATTSWGPGQDLYFEVARGPDYVYAGTPYINYGHNYYYFPHNFRYYYNTQWFYQDSGWYYWDGIIGGNWYADNAWRYYGNYWFYPEYNWYYYSDYGHPYYARFDAARIVTVEETDDSFCSDIDIGTQSVNVTAGENAEARFWIYNNGRKAYNLSEIVLLENDPEIDASIASMPYMVVAGGSEYIDLEVQAEPIEDSKSTTVYIRIEGYFTNGEGCGSVDAKTESFKVNIFRDNREIEGFEPEGEDTVQAEDNTSNNNTTSPQNTTAQNNAQEPEGQESEPEQVAEFSSCSCADIRLEAKDFELEENGSQKKTFYIRNNSGESFQVFDVQVFEDSEDVVARILGVGTRSIGAGSRASVEVSVDSFARELENIGRFSVSGAFADGKECSSTEIGIEEFGIRVGEIEELGEGEDSALINLQFPEKIEVAGTASFVVSINNPNPGQGYVRIYSDHAIVEPQTVFVEAHKTANVAVNVRELEQDAAWVFYEFYFPGVFMNPRITKLVKAEPSKAINGGKKVVLPDNAAAQGEESRAPTALAVLADNAWLVGLLIVILIVAGYAIHISGESTRVAVKPRAGKKTVKRRSGK